MSLSYSRINQAVNESDWDLVIELAEKAKAVKEHVARLSEAIRDPEKYAIVITGKNGETVTYEYALQPGERAEVTQTYDAGYEYGEYLFAYTPTPEIVGQGDRRLSLEILFTRRPIGASR